MDGARNVVRIHRGGEVMIPEHLSKDQDIRLKAGDRVEVMTPGGGGYGDPFNREPDLMRKKVARAYLNIGNLLENKDEWNVHLDVRAYVGLMRSGLPIYWCPCLPVKDYRSTQWTFKHGDVLEGVPNGLLNYFIYALQRPNPHELDPTAALSMDLRPWRHVLMGMERNMWCTSSLIHAAGRHIFVSRRGLDKGPIDEALQPFGLEREIVTIVGGFSTALALARASDLIANVPERHTGNLRAGMHSFPLPVAMPEITASLLWHPRLDADPAHRWLRGCVRDACALQRTNASPHAPRAARVAFVEPASKRR
jgi:hypothetical protein